VAGGFADSVGKLPGASADSTIFSGVSPDDQVTTEVDAGEITDLHAPAAGNLGWVPNASR
jgi:hypothetical protein